MRKTLSTFFTIFAIANLVFVFSGCDLFDKIDDVTFTATIPVTLAVNEPLESDTPVPYADMVTLDLTDNPEVDRYKNKIKEVKVTKITYQIINYDGGSVTFSDGAILLSSTEETLAASPVITLGNSNEIELTDVNLDVLNALGQLLKDDKTADITLEGILSSAPVAFQLQINFYTTITANAL